MAKAERAARRGFGSRVFGLINPIRDPSLLVAVILTFLEKGGTSDPIPVWIVWGIGNWISVKAAIWLLVNFAFSFVYLMRKTGWMIRNPRLAWRLLDALGTEEIIIGGLRPDMFATEDGTLHEGQLGMAPMMAAQYGYAGALSDPAYGYEGQGEYDGYNDYQDNNGYQANGNGYGYGRQPVPSMRLDEQGEEVRELLSQYAKLLTDWSSFTEEKWRAVSDSQLGWKPLRGRWNGWEEIYRDAFAPDDGYDEPTGADVMLKRFENSQSKGSAASAVACFLHDLDSLRQSLVALEGGEDPAAQRMGSPRPAQQISQRTGKSPIIRNPMIVDADR
jgi:hypothetical protein